MRWFFQHWPLPKWRRPWCRVSYQVVALHLDGATSGWSAMSLTERTGFHQ